MNLVRTRLVSLARIAVVGGGIGLLCTGGSAQPLSQSQAMTVLGGTLNPVGISNEDCDEPSVECSAIECNDEHKCGAGTSQTYQLRENYPATEEDGGGWETTKEADYDCIYARACANPCSQSTVDDKWYCGGPVGPDIEVEPVTGIEGDKPAAIEA